MKRCPQCSRDYNDPTLSFCLDDGAELLDGPAVMDEPLTAILPDSTSGGSGRSEDPTTLRSQNADPTAVLSGGTFPASPVSSQKRKRVVLVSLAVLMFAALGYFGYKYSYPGKEVIDSIAVLPFENQANDSETDYLSDGVAESIIYELSKVDELRVSPRSSVFRYKGADIDVEKIGKELDVDAILSGRIVQLGDDLTISVELTDVRNKRTLWGEQYRRKVSDLLKTQTEITDAITRNLRLKLFDPTNGQPARDLTKNNEAYRNYLRGLYYFNKRTVDGFKKSIESFQDAIDLDPGYALAYVGLTKVLLTSAGYNTAKFSDVAPRAKAAANKAIELDPDLAEAQVVNGLVLTRIDGDPAGAERAFKRALELNPNLADAHYYYGSFILRPAGRFDEAIASFKKALEIEPMSIPISANLVRLYYYAGRYDEALEHGRKVYALDETHPTTKYWLGRLYAYLGKSREVEEVCGDSVSVKDRLTGCDTIVAYSLAKEGKTGQAREILNRLRSGGAETGQIAMVLIALNEKEQALDELETGFTEDRYSLVSDVKHDPVFDPLRNEPRFKAMLEKYQLPR